MTDNASVTGVEWLHDLPGKGQVAMCLTRCRDCGHESVKNRSNVRRGKAGCRPCSSRRISGPASVHWKGGKHVPGAFLGVIRKHLGDRARLLTLDVSIEYLDALWIAQDGRCAYSGEPLSFGQGKNLAGRTASLDRKDSDLGYVEGNVQFVHLIANQMKWNYSEREFLDFVGKITRHRGIQ